MNELKGRLADPLDTIQEMIQHMREHDAHPCHSTKGRNEVNKVSEY
jgi:hypothetical protein